jgi:membrane-bound lytic murein transglycosylase B
LVYRLIFSAVLVFSSVFMLAIPAEAEASGSLWQNLVDFAKGRLVEEKKIIIENGGKNDDQSESIGEKRKEDKNKKDIPEDDISVEEIEKQAEFASSATGVRKDFLMGMLVVESALGQNTGKCTYQEVEEGAKKAHEEGRLSKKAWNTFQERKKTIQDLAEKLDYDYEKLKVSCNPSYAGTGGAMGVGQFMPDTWLEYEDRIAEIVDNDNPDPWSVRDGTVAMALKVSDVPGVREHNTSAEMVASKMYLSGTTSSQYNWYANEIQYWSRNYQKLIG